tara:strand:+ start:401 stop:565 length:165 start_codon:yes stop_codon:yes gene_type:complete
MDPALFLFVIGIFIKKAKRAQKSVTPYFLMALGLFIKTIIELQSQQTPLVNELQ